MKIPGPSFPFISYGSIFSQIDPDFEANVFGGRAVTVRHWLSQDHED
jgi:hypothetical protein